MAGYNFDRAQKAADHQIRRFGGAARLRRSGVDRTCTAAFLEYSPREKGLLLDGARRVLVSPLGLSEPPNHELDLLVFAGSIYRIIAPVGGPRPAGKPIYYDLAVVFQANE